MMKSRKITSVSTAALLSLSTLLTLGIPLTHAQSSGTNGQLFFGYSASSGSSIDIAAANTDGSQSHLITPGTGVTADVSFVYDTSPDGSKVLYMRKPDASANYSLVVANANGSSPVTLFASATNLGASYAAFSADGSTVFFEEQGSAATPGILTVPVTGGSPSVLIAPGANESFGRMVVSAANSKLFFNYTITGGSPSSGIKSADFNGANVTSLYGTADLLQDVSSDGAKLLITESVSNVRKLFSINAGDGSGHALVVDASPGQVTAAAYSPDATKVFYIDSSTGGNIRNANGSGTSTPFRTDAAYTVVWSKVANATSGTYPTPLATGVVPSQSGGGTGGGSSDSLATPTTTVVSDDQSSSGRSVSGNETLVLDGKVGTTIVASGGTIKGSGTVVGDLTVSSGAVVAPGHSPGCLTMNNLILNGTYQAEVGGTDPCSGYDQLKVNGTVDLTGSTLQVVTYNYFVPKVGQSYTIIDNDGSADAVTGTFNGIAEGGEYTNEGVTYTVTYIGGDGNDVVLTVKAVDASKLPKNPNTGFRLISANPLVSLISSSLLAGALFMLARRFNHAK